MPSVNGTPSLRGKPSLTGVREWLQKLGHSVMSLFPSLYSLPWIHLASLPTPCIHILLIYWEKRRMTTWMIWTLYMWQGQRERAVHAHLLIHFWERISKGLGSLEELVSILRLIWSAYRKGFKLILGQYQRTLLQSTSLKSGMYTSGWSNLIPLPTFHIRIVRRKSTWTQESY